MKIISSTTSNRVCKHMNKDHIDSVHKYLQHYGKISNFKEAYLEEISNQFMKINYDGKIDGGVEITILLPKKQTAKGEITDVKKK